MRDDLLVPSGREEVILAGETPGPHSAAPEAYSPVVSRLNNRYVSVRHGTSTKLYRVGDGFSGRDVENSFEIMRDGRKVTIKNNEKYPDIMGESRSGVIDVYTFRDDQEAAKFSSEFVVAATDVFGSGDDLSLSSYGGRPLAKSKFGRIMQDGVLLAAGAFVGALAAGLGWGVAEWLRL